MQKSIYILAVSIMLSGLSAHAAPVNSAMTKWGYEGNSGPAWWGKLDPAYIECSKGQEQSPVNIKTKKTIATTVPVNFSYHPAPLMLMDDGPTALVIAGKQTIFNDGHSIQVNFPGNTAETLHYNGVDYQLVQFHFHSPSETQLNSATTPLEIHFVHQSKDGNALVAAVFIEAGESNTEMKKIIEYIPSDHGVQHEIQGENINPAKLLPSQHSYYSYTGSLTTPPCTEGLQWIVLSKPITATPAQILKLRNVIGDNARPTQSLHGRKISYYSGV